MDKTTSSSSAEPSPPLWHLSLNDDATDTIVLLHGLSVCHAEFTFVWPHLSSYHVLIPDLNRHDKSIHVKPATIPALAAKVEELIRIHAHGGQAHVVGISMGGFAAMELARLHPGVIRSLFVTGCAPFEGWRLWVSRHSGILNALETVNNFVPGWLGDKITEMQWHAQGLTVPDTVRKAVKMNGSAELANEVLGSIADTKQDMMQEVKVRTLAVAGGKLDNVRATEMQGIGLKEGCPASRAAVVRKAVHGWALQFPELFARGVLAWVEERSLPEEFEGLSQAE